MCSSVLEVNTSVTCRLPARGPDQLSPLLSFKMCLIGFPECPRRGKERVSLLRALVFPLEGGGSWGSLISHRWTPPVAINQSQSPTGARRGSSEGLEGEGGWSWSLRASPTPSYRETQPTDKNMSSSSRPRAHWYNHPRKPFFPFSSLPLSNWFRSCLAPSGQGPSISAAVTGLCRPLTVLLYWCCAASYYCANENLAPDIIFFFTGCALSMQNILNAFIALKGLIIFNVCDRLTWNMVLWTGKLLLAEVLSVLRCCVAWICDSLLCWVERIGLIVRLFVVN